MANRCTARGLGIAVALATMCSALLWLMLINRGNDQPAAIRQCQQDGIVFHGFEAGQYSGGVEGKPDGI